MPKEKRAESRCRYLIREIAARKGWNVKHPQRGGDFFEEQEIEDHFPDSGLQGTKPDFPLCRNGVPVLVAEAKNHIKKINSAFSEAIAYADKINAQGVYTIRIAVGAAGEEDHGYLFKTAVLTDGKWLPLLSHGFALTSFPSVGETETALLTNNGTTEVTLPKISDYIATAISLSGIVMRMNVRN